MPDRGLYWDAIPDWQDAALAGPGVTVTATVPGACFEVSGNLAALPRTGAERLQLARNRLLLLGDLPAGTAAGWNPAGYAVTDAGAGLIRFDLRGPAATALVRRGTELMQGATGASARVAFAGQELVLWQAGGADWAILINRSLAAWLWSWLQAATAAMTATESEAMT